MDDLKSLFKAKGITYVQYQLTTIFGDLKTVSFPVQIWEDMADGAGVDGSSLNFLHTEQSDMIAVPDPNTFAVLPWESRVGRFICDLVDSDGNPHELDPRGILKKALSQAREMNYELQTRPELEWYFLNPDFSPVDEGQYMDTKPFDPRESIRFDITDMMIAMGIGVKTIHHECGPGQNEIELSPANALSQCDGVQTAKLIAKTNAMFNGIICTFMPKPFLYQAGSGLHIHQYLTQDGENVFAGEGREISDTLRYFVGGILEHIDGMTAILNPTSNSYKRLVPGHEAPVYKSWGVANRTALVRVPGYEKKAHIEVRSPDATTNIYLTTALILAAGLDGLNRQIEPILPTTQNVEHLNEQERVDMGIGNLPANLGDALDAFEQNNFVKNVLGQGIAELFLTTKRHEYEDYLGAKQKGPEEVLNFEYDHYLRRA